MKPPIIFLDVDGVLNRCGKSRVRLERPMLERLRQIVEATGAQIIVSSSWRKTPEDMDLLASVLAEYGLAISGKTKVIYKFGGDVWASHLRGLEIVTWLNENPGHDRLVILDDALQMMGSAHIQINSSEGLQDEHVERAIRMLKGGDAT